MLTHDEAFKLARRRDAAHAAKVEFSGRDHVWTPDRLAEWQRRSDELEAAALEWQMALYGRPLAAK